MQTRIRDRERLLALPWPEDARMLVASDLCPHAEPCKGRKCVWDWIEAVFVTEELMDQFSYVLEVVMNRSLDAADKRKTVFSDVPSPAGGPVNTKAAYGAAEVAAWWNEALKLVGYEIDLE